MTLKDSKMYYHYSCRLTNEQRASIVEYFRVYKVVYYDVKKLLNL